MFDFQGADSAALLGNGAAEASGAGSAAAKSSAGRMSGAKKLGKRLGAGGSGQRNPEGAEYRPLLSDSQDDG